jgi:hypothetical protein
VRGVSSNRYPYRDCYHKSAHFFVEGYKDHSTLIFACVRFLRWTHLDGEELRDVNRGCWSYSAETAEQRQHNLEALNKAAAAVMKRGHIPLIGVNAALPVLEWLDREADSYEAIMAISLALVINATRFW